MHENKMDPDDQRDIEIADQLIEQAELTQMKTVMQLSWTRQGTEILFDDGTHSLFKDIHPLKTNPRAIERLGMLIAVVQYRHELEIFIMGDSNGEGQSRSELVRYLREVRGCKTMADSNVGYFTGQYSPLAKVV